MSSLGTGLVLAAGAAGALASVDEALSTITEDKSISSGSSLAAARALKPLSLSNLTNLFTTI